MDFLLYKVIVIASLQLHVLSKCTGKTGPDCCFGFSWDSLSQSCKPCKPGYDGINCSQACRYPSFGLECQGECKCPPELCDISLGCVITSKAEYTEGTTDLPEKHKMTTETESQPVLYALNKQWLTAIIGLLCSIILIIVIYLCCGKKLKKKFSKKGKSTKSLQKKKQSTADSYTPLREQGYRQERIEPNPNQENTKAPSIYEEIDADHLEQSHVGDTACNMKLNRKSLTNRRVSKLSPTEDTSYLDVVDSGDFSSSYKREETKERCENAKYIGQDRESGTIDVEMCQQNEGNGSYLTAI